MTGAMIDENAKDEQAERVLVVDDDPFIREVAAIILTDRGYRVETASHGREGLEKFQAGRFDVVITDNCMPEMTGGHMAVLMHALAPQIPVILLSAHDARETSELLPGGMDRSLKKPFTSEGLCRTVRQALQAAAPLLAMDQSPDLAAVRDPDLPAERLVSFARHHDFRVRAMVASHRNTPGATLEQLAAERALHLYLAANLKTPGSLLAGLAYASDSDIQRWLIWNENTPRAVLEWIARTGAPILRAMARQRLQET